MPNTHNSNPIDREYCNSLAHLCYLRDSRDKSIKLKLMKIAIPKNIKKTFQLYIKIAVHTNKGIMYLYFIKSRAILLIYHRYLHYQI